MKVGPQHSQRPQVGTSWPDVAAAWLVCGVIVISALSIAALHRSPEVTVTSPAGVHVPCGGPLILRRDSGFYDDADEDQRVYVRRVAHLMCSTVAVSHSERMAPRALINC